MSLASLIELKLNQLSEVLSEDAETVDVVEFQRSSLAHFVHVAGIKNLVNLRVSYQ